MKSRALLLLLSLVVSACGTTPESYCRTAYYDCLQEAGWTESDEATCVSDWTALRDDAEAQGCEREFQDALDCQASNAMCWTEEDTATTTTTYGLLDDSACTSEFDSYAACYTEE